MTNILKCDSCKNILFLQKINRQINLEIFAILVYKKSKLIIYE